METNSKCRFQEYASSEPGQHFYTVLHPHPNTNQLAVIGRVWRQYGENGVVYTVKDSHDNVIFPECKDMNSIKKKFIESGLQLAAEAKVYERKQGLKKLRDNKSNGLERGIE